jgi:hypothetical protein
MLATALKAYSEVDPLKEAGKSLERVAATALLLYARSNAFFTPAMMCNTSMCGEGLGITLEGGKGVEYWEDITAFPTDPDTNSTSLQQAVERLMASKDCPGAIFHPSYKSNKGGDVYGLFKADREASLVLLTIQCKDWFKDDSRQEDGKLIKYHEMWRISQEDLGFLRSHDTELVVNGTRVTVRVLYLLVSSNELQEKVQCRDDEGVVTAASMRSWLPTAAYAMEGAHKLRQLFVVAPEEAVSASL